MTIVITHPETEALIAQRMATGAFQDVEDALLQALKSAPQPQRANRGSLPMGLVEVCAMVSGLTEDVDFTRDQLPARDLDLS